MKQKSQTSVSEKQDITGQLETVFRQNYASLVYFSSRIVGDKSDAEDIVQEAFVSYWNNREEVSLHPLQIKNFLYSVVKNSSLNFNRHQKIVETFKNNSPAIPLEENNIVHLIIQAEVLGEIHAAIASLPEGCQKISRMSYLEGMKNQEIAAELKVSINTVKTQKQRGIQLLRKKLDPDKFRFMLLFFLH